MRVSLSAVVVVLTRSTQRVISVYEGKLQYPELFAKRLVLIMVDFNIRTCLTG